MESLTKALTPDQILNSTMVADMCGVSSSAVSNWYKRNSTKIDLPEPWAVLGNVKLWCREDIEQFIADRECSQLEHAEHLRKQAERLLRRAETIEMEHSGA